MSEWKGGGVQIWGLKTGSQKPVSETGTCT